MSSAPQKRRKDASHHSQGKADFARERKQSRGERPKREESCSLLLLREGKRREEAALIGAEMNNPLVQMERGHFES